MTRKTTVRTILALAVTLSLLLVNTSRADELYAAPSAAGIRGQVEAWLHTQSADAELQEAVADVWRTVSDDANAEQLFDALMQTLYLADENARGIVDACLAGDLGQLQQRLPQLVSGGAQPLLVENVRYFVARYLAILTMYDESLAQFEQLDTSQVVDPAGCLFYRAVCEHSLLQKDEGLQTIETLLTSTEDVPIRYSTVAELMKHDLELLQERTLGEVARQMRDVERRLSLGQSGPDVQRVEERIITTLDEIIEKIEQQQGGGGGGGQGSQSGGQQSSNPASDSYVGGAQGPGEVEERDIGHQDGWGDLPDRAQAAAKEMINRQFPAHYRQAVEEYLKRIAQRPAPDGN